MFGGRDLLFADLSLYSSETSDFVQLFLTKKNEEKQSRAFNFTFHYIDDDLSLSTFGEFVNRIYSNELAIKDTPDPTRSTSYLELHIETISEGRLRTKL